MHTLALDPVNFINDCKKKNKERNGKELAKNRIYRQFETIFSNDEYEEQQYFFPHIDCIIDFVNDAFNNAAVI